MRKKTECEAQGGDLASVHSEEEWQFVKGVLDNTPSNFYYVWLGGSDQKTEGTWVWTDGSSVTYTDWYGNEPNSGTSRNCIYAYSGYNWQWFDYTCTWTFYAVCKIPA